MSQATQLGTTGNPQPYPLYGRILSRSGEPITDLKGKSKPAGFVYTPFLRVALQAKAAQEQGLTLTADDVNAASEPLVYVAFGIRIVGSEDDDEINGRLPQIFVINGLTPKPRGSWFVPRDARVLPVWTRPDTSPLRTLGIEVPDYVEAIAAFRSDVVRADRTFVVFKTTPDGRRNVHVPIGPRAEDVVRWR